jgi:hypothetical protein
MPKILRKLQKIFGAALTPSGNIAQIGSLAAGNPSYSSDPDVIQGLSRYDNGWPQVVVGTNSPAMQDMTALDFLITRQLAYLFQAGLAEWDAATPYYTSSWATDGGTGIYHSKTNDNIGNPLSDTNNWETLASILLPTPVTPQQLARGWVKFDGHSGAVLAGYNISGVVRNSVGIYTISFTNPMPSDDYVWTGNSGPYNGGSITGGNNNHLCGDGLQVAGQVRIANYEPSGGPIGPEDADWIWMSFFG